jgi:glycosyltransferase involved in cell wall biosynthesis
VLQVITDTDRRGAQVFALDLELALRRLGYEVETVALAPGSVGGLDIETLGPTRRSVSTLRALRRRAQGSSVVIAHGSTTLPVCAIALVGSGRPFIYRQISDSRFWASTPLRRARVRVGLARAAMVVSLWDGAAASLEHDFHVGAGKLAIVPNGVPADHFQPPDALQRSNARRAIAVDDDRVVALYLGALVPEKGVDNAIEAARAAGTTLVVAGDGPDRAALEQSTRASPSPVVFLGNVIDPREALWAADMLIFPTRGGDSMPAVVVEAGLCGLPVISTPVGAIAQMVVDSQTGCIVPVDDLERLTLEVQRLSGDGDERVRLGQNARDRCEDLYTIDVVARGWAEVIERTRG